ncbi:MAG: ABC transporter permease [Thermomicrobiales bacterium]
MRGKQLDTSERFAGTGTHLLRRMWRCRALYVMLMPALIYFILFHYYPYFNMIIAFKDYTPVAGVWGSPWVGLKYFHQLFGLNDFRQILINTLLISAYKIVFTFPIPVIFALMVNEVRFSAFKRTVQTVTTFPHFLSWVIFGGIMLTFLGPRGVIPGLATHLGVNASTLLSDPRHFRSVLVVTHILKEFGWNAIIYLAALATIDVSLYEAARVDGANRWQQMRHITLPGIRAVMVLLFILDLGNALDTGFEQVFVMYNPSVYSVADIIDTYVYRTGLVNGAYSLATAIGVFKGICSFALIYVANHIVKRTGEPTLW